MCIAFGISLLSRVRFEIYVISYLLPVNIRHLWFPTYSDVGHITTSLSVWPGPGNMDIGVGIY